MRINAHTNNECSSNDSDASPDIVADYVIALVSEKGPIDVVKRCAVEALSEILQARKYIPLNVFDPVHVC